MLGMEQSWPSDAVCRFFACSRELRRNLRCVSVQLGHKAEYDSSIFFLPVVPVGLGSGVGSIASGPVHSSLTRFLIETMMHFCEK